MKKTRVALVGCGKVGGLHCKAVAQIPEAEFIAVCDADSSRASKFAIEHKAQAFTTVEEMILKAKPDVLLIATPPPFASPTNCCCFKCRCSCACRKAHGGIH